MAEGDREFGIGGGVECECCAGIDRLPGERVFASLAAEADAALAEIIGHEPVRLGLALVPLHERENPAARAARGDALEALGGDLAEIRRKIGHNEKMVFLRHASGLFVVFGDRRVLVAQVHLDHFFDVFAQFRQPFLDLVALGPDAAVDQALLVIREVHEPRETFPESHGIDDGETEFSRRRGRQEAQDDVVQYPGHIAAARFVGFKKDRAMVGKSERERERHLRGPRQRKARVLRNSTGLLREVHVEMREFRCGGEFPGRLPILHELLAPRGEHDRGGGVHFVDGAVKRGDFLLPVGGDFVPLGFLLGGKRGSLGGVGGGVLLFESAGLGGVATEAFVAVRFQARNFPFHGCVYFGDDARRLRFELGAGTGFKFPLDFVGAAPLLLEFRECALIARLDALALLLERAGGVCDGGGARDHDCAGQHKGVGNRNRRRLRLFQTDLINEANGSDQNGGDDARDDVHDRSVPESDGQARACQDDEENKHRQRHKMEQSRERKSLEVVKLRLGDIEMAGKIVELLAGHGRLAPQLALERAVPAQRLARPRFQCLEHVLVDVQLRGEIGERALRFREIGFQLAFREEIFHLEVAHPSSFCLLRPHRQAAQR